MAANIPPPFIRDNNGNPIEIGQYYKVTYTTRHPTGIYYGKILHNNVETRPRDGGVWPQGLMVNRVGLGPYTVYKSISGSKKEIISPLIEFTEFTDGVGGSSTFEKITQNEFMSELPPVEILRELGIQPKNIYPSGISTGGRRYRRKTHKSNKKRRLTKRR